MNGSGKIRVVKADRSAEDFDKTKLAGSIWRSMDGKLACYGHADRLAEAVESYIQRKGMTVVTSAAVFEMVIKALRYVHIPSAADAAEAYRDWRSALRRHLCVRHDGNDLTLWDKGWLCEFACRSWHVTRRTGRILAGEVETELLRSYEGTVSRQDVVDLLNVMVSEYGLADAVPVGP